MPFVYRRPWMCRGGKAKPAFFWGRRGNHHSGCPSTFFNVLCVGVQSDHVVTQPTQDVRHTDSHYALHKHAASRTSTQPIALHHFDGDSFVKQCVSMLQRSYFFAEAKGFVPVRFFPHWMDGWIDGGMDKWIDG